MIVIDYQDRRPLYEQIVEKFKLLIMRGVLSPDEQMPSVRSLAVELSINPNTIQRAYAELERQGFIYPVKGRGNYVSPAARLVDEKKRQYREKLENVLREGEEIGFSRKEIRELLGQIWETKFDAL